MDGWRKDGWMDGKRTDGWIKMGWWVNGWEEGRIYSWKKKAEREDRQTELR